MVRVAITTEGIFPLSIGGIQKYSLELIKELNEKIDLEITVIHPHNQNLFSEFKNVKEVFIPYPKGQRPYILNCWLYSDRISDFLLKTDFDIIYAQGLTVWSNIKKLKPKIISNFHGLEPFQTIGLLNQIKVYPLKWAIKYVLRQSDITINEGGLLKDLLTKQDLKTTKIVRIPNAVHLNEEIQFEDEKLNDQINLLVICRLAHNKGIPLLLEAFDALIRVCPQKKFLLNVVGDGPLRSQLEAQYASNNIIFHGRVDEAEKEKLLQTADLFVFPTLFEGMPTAVLEAMSVSLPIVATRVGGIPDLVDHTNGFLIEKKSIPELTAALLKFSKLDFQDKAEMSKKSLEKVKAFSWQVVGDLHYDLFKIGTNKN